MSSEEKNKVENISDIGIEIDKPTEESEEYDKIFFNNFLSFKDKKEYYENQVKIGSQKAINYLGLLYEKNNDIPKMIKCFKEGIEAGNTESMNRLGLYYFKIKDYPKMMKYYQMAIDLNCYAGLNNLGAYYSEVENNFEKATEYFLKSIEMGNPRAMNNLGNIYKEKKDFVNMKKYYDMAVKLNFTESIKNLMEHYKSIKNDKKYVEYGKKGMALGNSEIILDLGIYYLQKNDVDKAIKHIKMSADKDNTRAMTQLAVYYDQINDFDNSNKYIRMVILKQDTTSLMYYVTYKFARNFDPDVVLRYSSIAEDIRDGKGMEIFKQMCGILFHRNTNPKAKLLYDSLEKNTKVSARLMFGLCKLGQYDFITAHECFEDVKKNVVDSEFIDNTILKKIINKYYECFDTYVEKNKISVEKLNYKINCPIINKETNIVMETGCCKNILSLQMFMLAKCPFCNNEFTGFDFDL